MYAKYKTYVQMFPLSMAGTFFTQQTYNFRFIFQNLQQIAA